MASELPDIGGHYVVCGYGRVGSAICAELAQNGIRFVVIDCDEKVAFYAGSEHHHVICGDATTDDVLLKAGIERAAGIVAALDKDSDNLFLSLAARVLNPSIFIVTRNEETSNRDKILRTAANAVVSPLKLGGHQMARLVAERQAQGGEGVSLGAFEQHGAPGRPPISEQARAILDAASMRARQGSPGRHLHTETYREFADRLGDILDCTRQIDLPSHADSLPFDSLFALAESIAYATIDRRAVLLDAMVPGYEGDDILFHSLNVALVAARVGREMQLSPRQLTELCVASLLHDVGMTKISADAFSHSQGLTDHQREMVEKHPHIGALLLGELEQQYPWLVRAIREEHKREHDGGYPHDVTGELHPYSKIIGVCDTYEALTHVRAFRKPHHPADAIRTLVGARKTVFDPKVLKPFVEALSIYPVGSLVELNHNRAARVVDTVPGAALSPVVCILDRPDADCDPELNRIDLSVNHLLHINRLIYTDEYYVPPRQETEKRHEWIDFDVILR